MFLGGGSGILDIVGGGGGGGRFEKFEEAVVEGGGIGV